MSKLFRLVITLALMFSSVFILNINPTAALEKYNHKGSAYSTTLKTEAGGTYYTNSSMVVVSASAIYANPSGKEQLLVYSRCEVVMSKTNARSCQVEEISARFGASDSRGNDVKVTNFIQTVAPMPSSSVGYLSPLTYYINPTPINAMLYTAEIIINSAKAKVTHSINDSRSAARVIYRNPTKGQVDVSTAYKYNEIPFKLPKKGLYANFAFLYPNAKYDWVAAKAKADYLITIDTGAISPLVTGAYTPDYAVVPHTIGR